MHVHVGSILVPCMLTIYPDTRRQGQGISKHSTLCKHSQLTLFHIHAHVHEASSIAYTCICTYTYSN